MTKERELLRRALYEWKKPFGSGDTLLEVFKEIEAHLAAGEEHTHEYVGKGLRPDHWRCIHCGKIIRMEESHD